MKCGSKIKISELVWVRNEGGGTPRKNKLRRNAQNGNREQQIVLFSSTWVPCPATGGDPGFLQQLLKGQPNQRHAMWPGNQLFLGSGSNVTPGALALHIQVMH